MALAGVDRGSGATSSGGTTLVITPASNLAAGSYAVLCAAYDNSFTSGTEPYTGVITDTKGNAWVSLTAATNTAGVANDGQSVRVFGALLDVGSLTTSDSITINFASTTAAQSWVLIEVTAASGKWAVVGDTGAAAQTSATPSISAGVNTPDMIVACVGRQANGTRTGDADTTNGNWSTAQSAGAGTTTSGSEMIAQYKVTNGTGVQSYDPTFGGASAIGVNATVELSEADRPQVLYLSPIFQVIRQ